MRANLLLDENPHVLLALYRCDRVDLRAFKERAKVVAEPVRHLRREVAFHQFPYVGRLQVHEVDVRALDDEFGQC